jgi:hypothetical protein
VGLWRPPGKNCVLRTGTSGKNFVQPFLHVMKMRGRTALLPNEVFRFVLKLREKPKLEHIKVRNASHCFFQEEEWFINFS